MTEKTRKSSKIIAFGAVGGFVGAMVMGVLAAMMPVNGAPFFVAAAMFMGMGSMSVVVGWMLHLITGVVVGLLFGAATSHVAKLRVTSVGRGAGLGLGTGVIVWVVFFMPMMALTMPALMSMSIMVVGSLVAHLIYGIILGSVVGLA